MTGGFGWPIDVGRSCKHFKPSSLTTTETDKDSSSYSKLWKGEKLFSAHMPVATLTLATDTGDARSLYKYKTNKWM
jgi:hypothetical protein